MCGQSLREGRAWNRARWRVVGCMPVFSGMRAGFLKAGLRRIRLFGHWPRRWARPAVVARLTRPSMLRFKQKPPPRAPAPGQRTSPYRAENAKRATRRRQAYGTLGPTAVFQLHFCPRQALHSIDLAACACTVGRLGSARASAQTSCGP